MRVTAVPAQITTVEDRIVGRLNLEQLLLLCAPVFGGGLLYAVIPPSMDITLYKIAFLILVAPLCGILAIRIKGKLVLFWLVILFRYWIRPRYYVFSKRSIHGREQYGSVPETVEETVDKAPEYTRQESSLSLEARVKVQELITNPAAKVAFETRKGGLYVRVTEVKQES
jgi:hypothetical protein